MGLAEAKTEDPYSVIDIDPDGDLLLETGIIGGGGSKFRVCSATLRRHSPVWKTMLFGPWKEAKPADGSEWVVELPDDPAFEMRITLYIMHGLFDQAPETLYIDRMFRLMILLNKYDMARIVKPWCTKWMPSAESSFLPTHITESLYIAWEMGNESLFTFRLAQISINTQEKGSGLVFKEHLTTLNVQGITLQDEDHLGPPDILDLISKIRKAVIEKIIAPVHEDLEARVDSTPCCTQGTSWNTIERGLCDAAVLGSIHRGMIKHGGDILPKFSFCISESPVQLASWLFPLMAQIQTLQNSAHQQCSLKEKYSKYNKALQDSIPEIVQQALKPGHKEYMASQRLKTGLAEKTETKLEPTYWGLT
ncbi:hypothetical protein B0T20DRAFT_180277 [Sordaria brevicollis]|uniref:BTB domain-containing protein n=1 Tax=Sordaria brevicollis TaxID=83679 RepID=A0AAE0PI44_SORBR|nr:hypothetical protein B0T20DRAFT_180277 [Sordaria brevicollis]